MTDAELEARFKVLGHELRCLVCQNQTLADSSADLAKDLKLEVEAQIRSGKSDQDNKNYLVARYGDFILYKPEVKNSTILLWAGPFALLGLGAVAWTLSRRRRLLGVGSQENIPTQTKLEVQQAKRLLDD